MLDVSDPVAFASEAALQDAVEVFFQRWEIPFRREHRIGMHRIDFALGHEPWGLLEIKNGLATDSLRLADAADYLEQCVKYRLVADLPVFLGPFFVPRPSLSRYFIGGKVSQTIASLSALGGRVDVGLFFVHCAGDEQHTKNWTGFQFMLRQQKIAAFDQHNRWLEPLWPDSRPAMVDLLTAGSFKDRK